MRYKYKTFLDKPTVKIIKPRLFYRKCSLCEEWVKNEEMYLVKVSGNESVNLVNEDPEFDLIHNPHIFRSNTIGYTWEKKAYCFNCCDSEDKAIELFDKECFNGTHRRTYYFSTIKEKIS